MGYAAGPWCYSSAAEAAASVCGSLSGVTGTGTLHCQGVSSVSGSSAELSMLSWADGDPAGSTYSITLSLASCEGPTVADGIALGWAVGAVWIAVASVLYLRKVWQA